MRKYTIAIIGGSQENTFKRIGSKYGCEILFHCGKTRNGATKKDFRPIIKKADCVVINLGACGHVTMDVVKELCKTSGTIITFQEGFGASGAIKAGLNALSTPAKEEETASTRSVCSKNLYSKAS
ncbi:MULTISPECIES: DUF2325 domain-containing protein [Bacillus]|uniref:DUF2325 domain-containing protein n=1 Tax=Bacillus TaxID=1386 RepID=UPI00273E1954|nr:DUF2325 domain-containing protein [Bacillus sp. MMSF_3328]